MDDHLSLESPAVDQLQVLLTPPAIVPNCPLRWPNHPLTTASSPDQTSEFSMIIIHILRNARKRSSQGLNINFGL